MKSIAYSPEALQFVRHSMSYCALVHPSNTPVWNRDTVEELRQLLADLYVAVLRLPIAAPEYYEIVDQTITESEYNEVRQHFESLFGSYDVFLDTYLEDMKYSDAPIGRSTAELLADLYQVLGDVTWIFRRGIDEYMEQALEQVRYGFDESWGSDLLALLRQLHSLLGDPDFLPTDLLEAPLMGDDTEYDEDSWDSMSDRYQ